MENKIVVTVIDESATVEAKNDRAHFSLSLRAKSESLDDAKNALATKRKQLDKMLEEFQSSGVKLDGDIGSQLFDYKLEHREGNEKMPAGFQSINIISFTVVIDHHLDNIYNACMKFDTNMYRPTFSIKDAVSLYEQALEKVSKNVKDKLQKECNLMGVSSDQLRIQNWNFGYEGFIPSLNVNGVHNYYNNSGVRGATGPQGPTGTMGATGPVGPTIMKIGSTYQELLDQKLEPGNHSVTVAARVNYVWA